LDIAYDFCCHLKNIIRQYFYLAWQKWIFEGCPTQKGLYSLNFMPPLVIYPHDDDFSFEPTQDLFREFTAITGNKFHQVTKATLMISPSKEV